MPEFSRSQPEVWQAVWQATHLTADGVHKTIRREQRTLRWQAIRAALISRFGRIGGLRTIELGSGTGDVSLLLALEGATPTLLDADPRALQLAAEKFAIVDLQPGLQVGDFLNLEAALRGRYD